MIRVYSPEAFEDYRTTKNFCMFENHWLTRFAIQAESKAKRNERRNKIMELLTEIHDTLDGDQNPSCYILKASEYVTTPADPPDESSGSTSGSGISGTTYYADIVAFFQEKHYDKLNEIIDRYITQPTEGGSASISGGGTEKINPHWASNNHPANVECKFGYVNALRREIGILRHLRLINYENSIKYSPFDTRTPVSEMLLYWSVVKECIDIQRRSTTVADLTLIEYSYSIPSHSEDTEDVRIFLEYLRTVIFGYVDRLNNGEFGPNKSAVIKYGGNPVKIDYSSQAVGDEVTGYIEETVRQWMNTEPQRSKRYSAMFQLIPRRSDVEEVDESVYFVIDREKFESLEDENSYNNYIKKLYLTKFNHNGSIVLQPSECIYSAEINGSWTVDLTHPYDAEERYSYLTEGCVLGIDVTVAREQTNEVQYFRVFDIQYNLNDITATAYPVAYEAAFEVPILSCDFNGEDNEGYTAKELARILNNLQRNKYRILTDINSNKMCIWGEETNLQEILVGDQDATFINMFGGEVVFDNYDYIINRQLGDNKENERSVYYSGNMTGMSITKNTWDLITRIEPLSSEGYSMVNPEFKFARRAAKYWFEGGTRGGGNDVISDDAAALKQHPFVHAKVIKYDDVYLVKTYDKETDGPRKKTKTEKTTARAKSSIKKVVTDITADYFDRARKGGLPDSRISKKVVPSTEYFDPRNSAGAKGVNQRTLRKQLPYGYILYSWEDGKKWLAAEVLGNLGKYISNESLMDKTLTPEEIEVFDESIQKGMEWCQKTQRAKWYWHNSGEYRYYGNKYAADPSKASKSWQADRVENALWNIDNYWFWFDDQGRAISKYLDWENYEWFEAEDGSANKIKTYTEVVENEKTKVEEKWANEKTKSYRFGDPNDHSVYVKEAGWWFERSATEHYRISENSTGNRRYIDKTEWIFSEVDGKTFYKSKDGKRYPVNGQFMYVSEKKGWYKFTNNGEMIGPYLSKANFTWHKDGKNWWYGDEGGTKIKCQWLKISGKWYFFNADGVLDKSTDDYDGNDPGKLSEEEKNKELSIDWNREGVGGGTSTSGNSTPTNKEDEAPNPDRDGVKAWLKNAVLKVIGEEIRSWHMALWTAMREDLDKHAKADLKTFTNAAITVDINVQSLLHANGYEKFAFLNDLKLGDTVHVYSSFHKLDVEERVMSVKYDCLLDELQEITLGYPKIKKSFINNVAKLHPHGIIQEYTPSIYLEDGYGGYLLTTDPADADVSDANGLEVE